MTGIPRACAIAMALVLTGAAAPPDTADGQVTAAVSNADMETTSAQAPRFDPESLGGFTRNLRRAAAEARELQEEVVDEAQ